MRSFCVNHVFNFTNKIYLHCSYWDTIHSQTYHVHNSPLVIFCCGFVHHWSRGKMSDIIQTINSKAFFLAKILNFNYIFIEIYSLWSNWQYVNIGSDAGLARNKWQYNISSNDGPIHRRIYASPSFNELRIPIRYIVISLPWRKRWVFKWK